MFESKKISKIQFKHTQFLSEGHMLSKVTDELKVEGKRFIMKDTADNEYLQNSVLPHGRAEFFTVIIHNIL